MSKIITITLNTAIDNIIEVEDFKVGSVVKAKSYLVQSGKGINVSRAVAGLNESVVSLGFVGKKDFDFFKELDSKTINIELDKIDGKTRMNVTILDSKHTLIIHTRATGYSLKKNNIQDLTTKLNTIIKKNDVVVISGSVPNKGISSAYSKLIKACKDRAVKVILDSNGAALEEGIKAKPDIIKPNIEELEALTSKTLNTEEDIVSAAKGLNAVGIGCVFVSNGEKGVILTKKDTPGYWKGYMDIHLSEFPGMEIGCGDAMVGGISVGLLNNMDIESLLRLCIGCATANLYAKVPGKIDQKRTKKFAREAVIQYFNH